MFLTGILVNTWEFQGKFWKQYEEGTKELKGGKKGDMIKS